MTDRQPLGIGIIGMGWMGIAHSRAQRAIADRFHASGLSARLVCCADEVESRAKQTQEQFRFERATTDWRQVVSDPGVEAVIITAPNHLHLEMVHAVAEAGKHVFCEKPVGRNPEETTQIVELASAAGVMTGVGFNYRWAPAVQYARQLIAKGRLGEITHYRGRFLVDYGSNPDGVLSWRFQRELAGFGTLGDLMSHVVDMAHSLAGPLKRVVSQNRTFINDRPLATPGEGTHFSVDADGPRGEVTNEDYVGALVEFANGAPGTLEVCRVVKGPRCEHAFEINGTKGELRWNYERMNELQVYFPDEHTGPQQLLGEAAQPFYGEFYPGPANSLSYDDLKLIEAYEFLKSIAQREPMAADFNAVLAVAQVQDAMHRSWTSSGWEIVGAATWESRRE